MLFVQYAITFIYIDYKFLVLDILHK